MNKAPRNQTLICSMKEIAELRKTLLKVDKKARLAEIKNRVLHQDIFELAPYLPNRFVDLLILDPPYNLCKNYNGRIFHKKEKREYSLWFENMLQAIKHTLKNDSSLYICSDWQTSAIIAPILENFFYVRNRITWEREKGRGAKFNWKNNIEDIWFCSAGDEYFFNVDAVKLKRKVIAPYRQSNGQPKDWEEGDKGNYRLTHPSNIWTDISVPFWSMSENTDHPTQKPEKLIAKLMLASSKKGGMVLDPFCGSGTSAVVAKKLRRNFVVAEVNEEYCCWCQKRLERASLNDNIQGYTDGIFWERNSFANQQKKKTPDVTTGNLL